MAVVTLTDSATGRRHNCYLGDFGTDDATRRYHRLIAEYLAAGRVVPAWAKPRTEVRETTVADLAWAYWSRRVAGQYADRHALTIRSAIAELVDYAGDLPAADLGPRVFRAWRDRMILPRPDGRGWSRGYANAQAARMRAMVRWAVTEEIVRPSVLTALQAVEPLRAGQTAAAEPDAVQPVAWADVDAIMPHVGRQVAAMIEVQRATGARACEVVQMRPCDIDCDDDVWIYTIPKGRAKNRKKDRVIPLGPRAQAAILPFLARPDDAYLFSPREALREFHAARTAARVTPASCGSRSRSAPCARAGTRYTTDSYRSAIWRACDRAFPPPLILSPAAMAEWRKAHRWSPHQIRHAVADVLSRRYDPVTASKVLGHSDALITTKVYTTRDMAELARVAKESS